ncbi:transposase [Streptomyces sp. NPDC053069]|uniref:transposase n=1 Tax=Streptomyces sp. NPDC053069 TaxID=3365695 RepID=UPI0037D69D41
MWVVDAVSFPKCGTASVGVARRWCGSGASGRSARPRSASSSSPSSGTARRIRRGWPSCCPEAARSASRARCG